MNVSAEHEASHGDVDHGLCDVNPLFVVLHEERPADPRLRQQDHWGRKNYFADIGSNYFAISEVKKAFFQLVVARRGDATHAIKFDEVGQT